MYATPSTDTAVAEAPDEKVGVASGVYKMASSLGMPLVLLCPATIYGLFASAMNLQWAVLQVCSLTLNCSISILYDLIICTKTHQYDTP